MRGQGFTIFYFSHNQKLGHIFPYSGTVMELKFTGGAIGILNDEAWYRLCVVR